jgi:adenosine deaminase
LRLHPAINYFNSGIKISISPDDPGSFGAKSLWDFFVCAFSFEFDLLEMKRVIMDSIECSMMAKDAILKMKESFQLKWDIFLNELLSGNFS